MVYIRLAGVALYVIAFTIILIYMFYLKIVGPKVKNK